MPRKLVYSAVAAVLLSTLWSISALAASDVVTVGTVVAGGNTVDVPIYIRDVSGTPLGMDQPPGSKIQSFSIKVTYAPSSAVQSVTIARAGITSSLNPTFESKPATSNSISIIETFQESTNLIPFTLNASSPGNLVAHMTFTLSASATAGTSISLTLDPSVTQLADEGGTPGTNESQSKSNLNLVNGAINVPSLSVTLTPSTKKVPLNGTAVLGVLLNIPAPSNTTVNLNSSDTTVAHVPSSVVIASGASSADFNVSGVALGTAVITATLGSSTSTSNVTVVTGPAQCNTPAIPLLSAPASANTGASYVVSWAAAADATEYQLDESTTADFASGTTTQTLTATSASFTHTEANTRYYYRVRAHNASGTCNVFSDYSTAMSVLITPAPVAESRFLAVVGSVQGSFGSNFKTSVQLYNPKTVSATGKIVFHTQGASGSSSDPSLSYSVAPGKTLVYADLLPAMGIASGLGTADIIADLNSPLPVMLVRVFNDAGASGTTGLVEEAMSESDSLKSGSTAALLAPSDVQKFRLNIGIRTLSPGAEMTITVRDKDGVVVKTVTKSFAATFFTQPAAAQLLDGYTLAGGESINFNVTSGSAIIYGSTTDNTTNDPSIQFAKPY